MAWHQWTRKPRTISITRKELGCGFILLPKYCKRFYCVGEERRAMEKGNSLGCYVRITKVVNYSKNKKKVKIAFERIEGTPTYEVFDGL